MIILIGLMGSGKSTIGKQLAPQLHLNFIDLDESIVKAGGKTIPQIFKDDGEQAFRNLESQCLATVLQQPQTQVVATGGGVILAAENRTLIQAQLYVIWLDASPDILASRIAGDSNRPLLHDVNPLDKVKALAAQRNPIYAELAHLKVDTSKLCDKEAVAKIIDFLSDCDA